MSKFENRTVLKLRWRSPHRPNLAKSFCLSKRKAGKLVLLYQFPYSLGTYPVSRNTFYKAQIRTVPGIFIQELRIKTLTVPLKLTAQGAYLFLLQLHCLKVKLNSPCNLQAIIVRTGPAVVFFFVKFNRYLLIPCVSAHFVFRQSAGKRLQCCKGAGQKPAHHRSFHPPPR